MFPVDVEFLQIKVLFEPGEESFDTGASFVFLMEPLRIAWSDSGFGCFDNRCYVVFQQGLPYGSGVKGEISDEEPCVEPRIKGFYLSVESVELLRVMDVCCRDGKSGWEFGFWVDHYMEFIPVHILFFDVIPAPFCFGVIQIGWDDGAVLDDGGNAEEFFGDELLDDLVE